MVFVCCRFEPSCVVTMHHPREGSSYQCHSLHCASVLTSRVTLTCTSRPSTVRIEIFYYDFNRISSDSARFPGYSDRKQSISHIPHKQHGQHRWTCSMYSKTPLPLYNATTCAHPRTGIPQRSSFHSTGRPAPILPIHSHQCSFDRNYNSVVLVQESRVFTSRTTDSCLRTSQYEQCGL